MKKVTDLQMPSTCLQAIQTEDKLINIMYNKSMKQRDNLRRLEAFRLVAFLVFSGGHRD